jgi:hypothetical protein
MGPRALNAKSYTSGKAGALNLGAAQSGDKTMSRLTAAEIFPHPPTPSPHPTPYEMTTDCKFVMLGVGIALISAAACAITVTCAVAVSAAPRLGAV